MNDLRGGSPSSEHYSDGMDSLSMRDKSLLKRSVSKHHNNNFKAGYVPVHEQYLHKTGIRGRKTFAFWTLIGLLFTLAVGNLILTTTILGVLRLGQGMQSLELVPEESSIKFFGDADLGDVYKRDGKLEGYLDIPVEISGHNGSIMINFALRNGRPVNKVKIGKNGTVFRHIESFEVRNGNGKIVFTTSSPNLNILRHVRSINTQSAQTNRVVSPVAESLEISGKTVNLKGAEGTNIEGMAVLWTADQDIFLKSQNGSIVLSGKNGTTLDFHRIPITKTKDGAFVTSQYKVCVCMPQGKLFRIPVPNDSNTKVFCNHINLSPQHNPCI